jgi:hypothetical protein
MEQDRTEEITLLVDDDMYMLQEYKFIMPVRATCTQQSHNVCSGSVSQSAVLKYLEQPPNLAPNLTTTVPLHTGTALDTT